MSEDDLRPLMRSTDPEAIALWHKICDQHTDDRARATAILRGLGVRLAHPDDGWVRRRPDGGGTFSLSWYPLFDDHPEAGDLIAFGYPYAVEHALVEICADGNPRAASGYRLVRVTRAERRHGVFGGLLEQFAFEATEMTWPPVAPAPRGKRLRHKLRGLVGRA